MDVYILPFVFKSINDRMFQQKTGGDVSLYHITQLYRKVGMYLCHTEYQYPSSYKNVFSLEWLVYGSLDG